MRIPYLKKIGQGIPLFDGAMCMALSILQKRFIFR